MDREVDRQTKPSCLNLSGDLVGILREEFDRAVHECREVVDPCEDWDRFVDALWDATTAVFAIDVSTSTAPFPDALEEPETLEDLTRRAVAERERGPQSDGT